MHLIVTVHLIGEGSQKKSQRIWDNCESNLYRKIIGFLDEQPELDGDTRPSKPATSED